MPTYPSVEFAVQKQTDNIAAYKKALLAAAVGRGSLWQMVDDANDQIYENRVKGATITAVDHALDATGFGSNIAPWFSLHEEYFSQDAGLGNFDQALAAYRWRVSQHFNMVYFEARGSYLTPANVFPRDDIVLGTHTRTGDVFVDGAALNVLQAGSGKIMAVANAQVGGAAYNLSATLARLDGSLITLPVSFAAAAGAGSQRTFGEQALGANAAAGQPTLLVASTAQFVVGDTVLVEDANNAEWGIVLSMVANTSITLTTNLRNGYLTANGAKVTPMYADVTAVTSGGTGTDGDAVTLRFNPDRTVGLGYVHVPV